DGRGGLARAEAGDPDLLSDLAVGAVEVRFELVERHLDIDLHARRAQLLDGALQRFLLGGQVYRTVYSCRVRAVHAGARGAYAWFVGSPVSTAGGRGEPESESKSAGPRGPGRPSPARPGRPSPGGRGAAGVGAGAPSHARTAPEGHRRRRAVRCVTVRPVRVPAVPP